MSTPLSIATLLNPPSSDLVFNDFVTTLVSLGLPADKWKTGGTARTILRVVANLYAGFALLIVGAVGYGSLETATGGWLTRLAYYVYGVVRRPATFAGGPVRMTNTASGIYSGPAYAPGQVTFQDSTTNKTYVNTQQITLGAGTPGSPTSFTVSVAATEVGSASSAPPGQIDTLVNGLLGVTVTNDSAVVGLDAETDPDLVIDCQNKRAARSIFGPQGAYAYYATHDANDNPLLNSLFAPVNINRVTVSNSSHTGVTTVYLAAPEGLVSIEDFLAAQASMTLNALPGGVTLVVLAAQPTPYTPQITIWAKAVPGLVATDLIATAGDAVSTFISVYPIGGYTKGTQQGLFGSAIDGAIYAASPAIFSIDGATDLPLDSAHVATDALPTFLVRLV